MSETAALLGTLAIILTFAGVFRFSKFFFSTGTLLNLLIAISFTVMFMMLFEHIIFLFGVLALLAPIGALIYLTDIDNSLRSVSTDSVNGIFNTEGAKSSASECPFCGEENEPGNDYCMTCHRTINDD